MVTGQIHGDCVQKEKDVGMIRKSLSTYLFCVPSFLSGIARIFDLGATFNSYNKSDSPSEDDYKAIYSDWLMIGKDIENSMGKITKIIHGEK